jgi:hypothetical protein
MQLYPDDYPFNRFLFLELTFNYCHRGREMKKRYVVRWVHVGGVVLGLVVGAVQG